MYQPWVQLVGRSGSQEVTRDIQTHDPLSQYKKYTGPDTVGHAYNPSYSSGRDRGWVMV
jgi:hypothetical protein